MSYPYLAKTILKYKSPHATDLSFAKDETIRVTGPSDDDEDWLVGENLDGSKSGGFPKDFIIAIEESQQSKVDSDKPVPTVTEPKEPLKEGLKNEQYEEVPPSKPPVSILEPAPPSPQLDPSSRLPTPSIAPSPAPPSPSEPPTSTLPPNPSALTTNTPVKSSQPKATNENAEDSPPKPQSMKDRLAFFAAAQNKPAPPPIKPKPATGGFTWSQRQKLRQEQEAKEQKSNPPPTTTSSTTSELSKPSIAEASAPALVVSIDEKEGEGKGMSAADAVSSITKGQSLKERMAALQNQGAFGAGNGEEKKAGPVPVSSGKVWKRPPAPPAPEPEFEGEAEEGSGVAEQAKSPVTERGDSLDQAGVQTKRDDEEKEQVEEEEEEEDEEEKEKARRAAIAARMAKLGARGPMGMMPPAKPVRKPTKEVQSPTEEKSEPMPTAFAAAAPAGGSEEDSGSKETIAVPVPVSIPEPTTSESGLPKSIPIAAMPRRTAPPRRRGPTATSTSQANTAVSAEEARANPKEPENRFEGTDENGLPVPPPQVMVAGEEDPLPKTERQLEEEKQAEEAGRGQGGLEGAQAAGIALAPIHSSASQDNVDAPIEQHDEVAESESGSPEEKHVPLVGAIGGADAPSRGAGIASMEGEGEIIDKSARASHEIEEALVEGGDEKDDILKEAQGGRLHLKQSSEDPLYEDESTPLSPDPIGMIPLHPPANDGSIGEGDETPPLPPPRSKPRGLSMDIPLDELELRHEHDHTHDQQADEDDEDDMPPPLPSARRASLDKPAGPRPLPSPRREGRALPPPPVGSAMIPPREDSDEDQEEEDEEEEEDVPPPPPARPHQTPGSINPDAEDEEDEIPPPPPHARPFPPPVQAAADEEEDSEDEPPPLPSARVLPPPPAREPQDDSGKAYPAVEDEEDEAPPPPPPARQPSMPPPIQTSVTASAAPPKSPAAPSPVTASSPTMARALPSQEMPASPKAEDEEATRRSGIAARMAKLGGIKFGMPPPTFKKSSRDVTSPPATEAVLPQTEELQVDSPIDKPPPIPSPGAEQPASNATSALAEPAGGGEETPEQEAARRRATLARLRAGGALGGFGLFNHGSSAPSTEAEDTRGLEAEKLDAAEAASDDAPSPPARSPVTGGRLSLGPPANVNEAETTEEEAPPPPPPGRPQPTISTSIKNEVPVSSTPGPQTPTSPMPASPVRTPSGRRPPVPTEKRFSQSYKRSSTTSSAKAIIPEDRPTSIASDWQISDEPAVIMSQQQEGTQEPSEDAPPPPPPVRPPPPPQAQSQQVSQSPPRRSSSFLSRRSRSSIDIPPTTPSKASQHDIPVSPAQPSPARQSSISRQPPAPPAHTASAIGSQGGRPGFDQLKEASATYGAQLARSAHQIFSGGRKAQVGDGSPAGFVLLAMDQAQLPRPSQGWGQVVFEQEAGSILRRYDDPRPGDIAAFHDAKLKGKKGLSTYNQHVGSVQEPLIGIVAEFEDRKHKLRILQVERGVPEEVSYRCEDLKSGKIIIYRPGL
ncbi:uncharacterized protein I206_104806 [Kwoniella pini CBS 10737]|uniref:SH3 domain-containing protein n=1 Tax=Kwoniella pini CBS 10737 TaxID=1296096 RepID=A0A1B9I7U0_9TREE|nr:uncharacterized protein I206_02345 [Kwoniella pini CBS 10737]OCF51630.1 hypothetical protein I206_02345 [Kwoniella pini CBS 10737]